jgi:nitrile hydratase
MSDRFNVGDRVRVRLDDPVGHTRVPRYVRGHVGEVVERDGRYPLPDALVAGQPSAPSTVYSVRFDAARVWGRGEHTVTVNLWEEYLEAADGAR